MNLLENHFWNEERWSSKYIGVVPRVTADSEVGPQYMQHRVQPATPPSFVAAQDWHCSEHQTADMAFFANPTLQCDHDRAVPVQSTGGQRKNTNFGGQDHPTPRSVVLVTVHDTPY